MSKKLGQESAYPEPFVNDPHLSISHTKGMSKRFYAACAAMQGILSNSNPEIISLKTENIIEWSYMMADELLKQEND